MAGVPCKEVCERETYCLYVRLPSGGAGAALHGAVRGRDGRQPGVVPRVRGADAASQLPALRCRPPAATSAALPLLWGRAAGRALQREYAGRPDASTSRATEVALCVRVEQISGGQASPSPPGIGDTSPSTSFRCQGGTQGKRGGGGLNPAHEASGMDAGGKDAWQSGKPMSLYYLQSLLLDVSNQYFYSSRANLRWSNGTGSVLTICQSSVIARSGAAESQDKLQKSSTL